MRNANLPRMEVKRRKEEGYQVKACIGRRKSWRGEKGKIKRRKGGEFQKERAYDLNRRSADLPIKEKREESLYQPPRLREEIDLGRGGAKEEKKFGYVKRQSRRAQVKEFDFYAVMPRTAAVRPLGDKGGGEEGGGPSEEPMCWGETDITGRIRSPELRVCFYAANWPSTEWKNRRKKRRGDSHYGKRAGKQKARSTSATTLPGGERLLEQVGPKQEKKEERWQLVWTPRGKQRSLSGRVN